MRILLADADPTNKLQCEQIIKAIEPEAEIIKTDSLTKTLAAVNDVDAVFMDLCFVRQYGNCITG